MLKAGVSNCFNKKANFYFWLIIVYVIAGNKKRIDKAFEVRNLPAYFGPGNRPKCFTSEKIRLFNFVS